MAVKRISELVAGSPPYTESSLVELSVPNGSGGFDSRKVKISELISIDNTRLRTSATAGINFNYPGVQIVEETANINGTILALSVGDGSQGAGLLILDGVGPNHDNQYGYMNFSKANGSVGSITAALSGDVIGMEEFSGYGATQWPVGCANVQVYAAENFDDTHFAGIYRISTVDLNTETLNGRFEIDGGGHSRVQNGTLVLDKAYTVSTLPSSPTLGMQAVVTDGTSGLAWGATLTGGGGQTTKYLVWYNGTNWTVIGK